MAYQRPAPIPNNYMLIPKEHRTGAGVSTPYADMKELRISVPFRMGIVGGSDTFKSNAAFEIIKRINCWGRILIFSGKLDSEDLYRTLFAMGEEQGIHVVGSNKLEECPPMEELESSDDPCLILIDDMLSVRDIPEQIYKAFEYGRKVNGGVSIIFISQYYYKIPLLIRNSINYLLLKKIERDVDLKRIFTDYGVPKEMLAVYKNIVEVEDPKYRGDWFMIDRHGPLSLRYRHNWTPVPVPGLKVKMLARNSRVTVELVDPVEEEEQTAVVVAPRRRHQR